MAAPLDLTGTHRQQRLGAVECLNLRFLVDAQHQGAVGWVEVEPDDVAHLVDKPRVSRQLEGFEAVRLQSKGPPDAPHARGRDAAGPRFVEQPVEAALDKAPAPLADGLHPHPLACRNRLVAQPRGTTQHDPRPQCQGLHRLAPPRIAFQYPRDFTRQFDLRYRATRSHPPPPMQSVVELIHKFLVRDTSLFWRTGGLKSCANANYSSRSN